MFGRWLKKKIPVILFVIGMVLVYLLWLQCVGADVRLGIYPSVIIAFIGIMLLVFDYLSCLRRYKTLSDIRDFIGCDREFPEAKTVIEEELIELINQLTFEHKASQSSNDIKTQEMVEYYNLWVHQIKTPIAGMRLKLDDMDSDDARILKSQLQRIEQYVEMVLVYQRLDSNSTDYVFEQNNINTITKSCVKRFMNDFIGRHISIDYQVEDKNVITDAKWISFVIEQVISNAIKYTNEGKVSIRLDGAKLIIEDTGIGIRQEDLPRIFDKGYTGNNGRVDKRASGLGLYLCKRVCDNLGHTIKAESQVGKGTTIIINLDREERIHE